MVYFPNSYEALDDSGLLRRFEDRNLPGAR
jgi:hypothetical protein